MGSLSILSLPSPHPATAHPELPLKAQSPSGYRFSRPTRNSLHPSVQRPSLLGISLISRNNLPRPRRLQRASRSPKRSFERRKGTRHNNPHLVGLNRSKESCSRSSCTGSPIDAHSHFILLRTPHL